MGLEIRVFDQVDAPQGKRLDDQPDRFFSAAISHAKRSPERFPILAKIDPQGITNISPEERAALKAEWLTLECLAIGKLERAKWQGLFQVLLKEDSFQALQFVGN